MAVEFTAAYKGFLQPKQKAEKLPKRKMLQKSNKRIPSLTMGIQAL